MINETFPLGETLPGIGRHVDSYSYRLPLGVCSGIAPFNVRPIRFQITFSGLLNFRKLINFSSLLSKSNQFPGMIPLWMFPLAIMVG